MWILQCGPCACIAFKGGEGSEVDMCEKGWKEAGRLVVCFGEAFWQVLWRWVGV